MPWLRLINKHPLYTSQTLKRNRELISNYAGSLLLKENLLFFQLCRWLHPGGTPELTPIPKTNLCAEAVFLQLNSDAAREWQNRKYGERKFTNRWLLFTHPAQHWQEMCPTSLTSPQLLLWIPNGKSSLFKTKYLFHWEVRSLFFRTLHTEQDAHTLVLTISALSIEELLEFKWAHVCSRGKETNTNRLSNLLSPHLQKCPRGPCSASSKFSLSTRNKKEAEVSEEEEEEDSYQPTKVISLKTYIQRIWAPLGPIYRNWAMTNIICPSSLLAWFFICQETIIWGCNCFLIWAIQFCSETRETGLTLNPLKQRLYSTWAK